MTGRRWVALLRGVNVGGGNKVPMAALRALCGSLGWRDVRSYIASGNLVFDAEGTADTLATDLRSAMAAEIGVDVPVLVLPGHNIRAALAACPFDPADGRRVHAFFLWSDPVVDWTLHESLRAEGEELIVADRIAWLHTPGGFGTSKLADKLPKVVAGTQMTGRNLNTLRKLVEMLDD